MKQPYGIPKPDAEVKITIPMNVSNWRDNYDNKSKILKWGQIFRFIKAWFS